MVHLVTKASAVACLLFHVEHSPGCRWFWRWRITGGYPAPYLAWREGSSDTPRLMFHPEIVGSRIEAEWRESPDHEWRQAALRECAPGTARFHIRAEEDFRPAAPWRAFAEVAGMVACYCFHPLDLRAGVETIIEGRAEGPYPDNVLLAPGEFVSQDAVVRIENTEASTGSLVEVPSAPPVMTLAPGADHRRFFALRHAAGVYPKLMKPQPLASCG